ncbi:glycosyltransferase N-terminal domain-containing protein [Acetobacter sp.]|uniref:glycosyltransferase N-terminal domain-containing protein n=1 Tax=Acetobacter sp. TaxID=440 RepID=UPI0039E79FFA
MSPSPPAPEVSWSQRFIEKAIRQWLGFSLRTTRWHFDATPEARALLLKERGDGQQPGLLVAFWHEALALSPALWWWTEPRNPSMQLHVLISRNRDGRLIANIVAPWRIPAIHGSSDKKGKNKGGAAALRQIRIALEQGHTIAVMPDGPKGPHRHIQPGVLALAEKTGVPIIPVGVQCRCIHAPSWDRMILPLPFGRGRIVCGEPVHVKDGKREAAATQLRERLNAAQEEAGRSAGSYPERLAPMPPQCVTDEPVSAPAHPSVTQRTGAPFLWNALASALAPALIVMLRYRLRRGKELGGRLWERLGLDDAPRPVGPLVWFHAASVGETVSILPVLRVLLETTPAIHILVTTGTVTGSRTLTRELPQAMESERLLHRFVPLDVPRWVRRFLHHWRPDCLVLTESELWPNMIAACNAQGIPVTVINGRLSRAALSGWQRARRTAGVMMASLSWVAARSPEDAARFRMLGANNVFYDGDLKTAAPPLSGDPELLQAGCNAIGKRPVWIAASTHPGEEQNILTAAKIVMRSYPDLLTIIAPRHPERGATVASEAQRAFPSAPPAPRRSQGKLPTNADPIWVVDTLGELGTLFQLSSIVFMGNSLFPADGTAPGGGHNPFEPARFGCAVASGSAISNFEEAFEALGNATTIVNTPQELARWVETMLSNPDLVAQRGAAGRAIATRDQALPIRLADLIQRTMRHA